MRTRSWALDLQAPAGGGGDGSEVLGVRADHKVVTAEGALDDGDIDDIVRRGAGSKRADSVCLVAVERFDVAADEQACEERLAAAASPRLGNDGSGRHLAACEQSAVAGPHRGAGGMLS